VAPKMIPQRQIRAVFDEESIRIYQAYSNPIADSALKAGKFVSPSFKMDRMTWIKPSFLWMMYRCGWASKRGQERVLAIDITREGFDWALAHSCLSHFEPDVHESYETWQEEKAASQVRIQWDPERGVQLERLKYRSIQIGLSGDAVRGYVDDWILRISDLTGPVVEARNIKEKKKLIPSEQFYPVPDHISRRLGIMTKPSTFQQPFP